MQFDHENDARQWVFQVFEIVITDANTNEGVDMNTITMVMKILMFGWIHYYQLNWQKTSKMLLLM